MSVLLLHILSLLYEMLVFGSFSKYIKQATIFQLILSRRNHVYTCFRIGDAAISKLYCHLFFSLVEQQAQFVCNVAVWFWWVLAILDTHK
jgi:hypothetical protein